MTEFRQAHLIAIYRSVLGEAVPDNIADEEIVRQVARLTANDAKRLAQALREAGIDDFLASVCPYSNATAWATDDCPIELTNELREKGLAYLKKMLADGPVGLEPPTASSDK